MDLTTVSILFTTVLASGAGGPESDEEAQGLYCRLEGGERAAQEESLRDVLAAAEAVEELADGYAFRLASDPSPLLRIAEVVDRERRCCPFFRFEISVEPDLGPIWLRLRGRQGVKELLTPLVAGE